MNYNKIKKDISSLKSNKKPSNIKTWLKVFPDLTEEEQAELDGKTVDEFIDDDMVSDIIDGVYDDELEAIEAEILGGFNEKQN